MKRYETGISGVQPEMFLCNKKLRTMNIRSLKEVYDPVPLYFIAPYIQNL